MKIRLLVSLATFLWECGAYACPIEDGNDITAGYALVHTAKSLEAGKGKKASESQIYKAASSRTAGSSHVEENFELAESYINISRAVFQSPEDPPGIVPMVGVLVPIDESPVDRYSRASLTPRLFSLLTILKSEPYTVFISNGWGIEFSPEERRALANEIAAKPIIKLCISSKSLFSGVGGEYFIKKLNTLQQLKTFEISYAYLMSTEGWRLMGQSLSRALLETIDIRYTSMTSTDLLVFANELGQQPQLQNVNILIHNLQESDFIEGGVSEPFKVAQDIEKVWTNCRAHADIHPQEKRRGINEAFLGAESGYYTLHFQIQKNSS